MTAQWQGINSIMINPHKDTAMQEGNGAALTEMKWGIDLNNSINRRIVNESHATFLQLQDAGTESSIDNKFLGISVAYRSMLQTCKEEVNKMLSEEKDDSLLNDLRDQCDLISIMEMVWHLTEILILVSQPGGYCLSQLLGWVKQHFTDVDEAVHSLIAADDVYNHPEYWHTINGLLLQGRLSEVADLLKHHPQRDQSTYDEFASIEELLLKMPVFEVYQGQSVNDFQGKWKAWQDECCHRFKDGDFDKIPQLKGICEVLTGQSSALENCRNFNQSWYEMLVAKLLYTEPTVTIYNLKRHAVPSINMFSSMDQLTPLDKITVALLALDVHKTIQQTSEVLPNWWFSSHLADLLYHSGKLPDNEDSSACNLREHIILEYSATLMSHPSFTFIAADYLMSCPSQGRQQLQAYIDKLHLDSEKKALKVIRLCEKFKFNELVGQICKRMGLKAMRRKRLGVALSWCLRSKDEEFASLLTEEFLTHYVETGTFVQSDLIGNLGSSMFLNNKLTFLAKYQDFHSLYGDAKFKEAGGLLTSLFQSNLAPKRFWSILLIDSLPLLEAEELVLDSEQTFELMGKLKELQLVMDSTGNEEKMINKMQEEAEEEKIQAVQLALTRNLARALLVC